MAGSTNTPVVAPPSNGDADPTALTTQQTLREITMLRELLEARLDAQARTIDRVEKDLEKLPGMRHEAVENLQKLIEEKFRGQDEKFSSVHTQFTERDVRTEQSSKDNKVAIDAALQAQEKAFGAQNTSNAAAINKTEAGFDKRIDSIGELIRTTAKASDDKIDDMKTRLTVIESRTSVSDPAIANGMKEMLLTMNGLKMTESKAEGRGLGRGEVIAYIVAAVGFASALVGLAVRIFSGSS